LAILSIHNQLIQLELKTDLSLEASETLEVVPGVTVDVITTTLVEMMTSLEESGPAGVVLGPTVAVITTTLVEAMISLEVVFDAIGIVLETPVDNGGPVDKDIPVADEDDTISEELVYGYGG
jgi:hypothetical protein